MKNIFVVFLALFLLSCGSVGSKSRAETKWLYEAVPKDDFEVAVKNNDYRFIGFRVNGIHVPFVGADCVQDMSDIRFFDSFSHETENYEQRKIFAVANVYAKEYNTILFLYLRDKRGFNCNS